MSRTVLRPMRFAGLVLACVAIGAPSGSAWSWHGEYAIRYLGMDVVIATLQAENASDGGLRVQATARTTRIASLIYSIDNLYLAEADSVSLAPRWWSKKIRQSDVTNDLRVTPVAGTDRALYTGYGEHPLPPNSTPFVALLATLPLRSWAVGDTRSVPLDLEGRHILARLRCTRRETRQLLGIERECSIVAMELEEQATSPGNILPRTDMLTHHLADDDYHWEFPISDDGILMGADLHKPTGGVIRATLTTHRMLGSAEPGSGETP